MTSQLPCRNFACHRIHVATIAPVYTVALGVAGFVCEARAQPVRRAISGDNVAISRSRERLARRAAMKPYTGAGELRQALVAQAPTRRIPRLAMFAATFGCLAMGVVGCAGTNPAAAPDPSSAVSDDDGESPVEATSSPPVAPSSATPDNASEPSPLEAAWARISGAAGRCRRRRPMPSERRILSARSSLPCAWPRKASTTFPRSSTKAH